MSVPKKMNIAARPNQSVPLSLKGTGTSICIRGSSESVGKQMESADKSLCFGLHIIQST
jgi:hypothetical protein